MSDGGFSGWAILELMGHRRLAGYVDTVEIAGTRMLRIDVPGGDDGDTTQFYGGQAVYCLTPTTEDLARRLAESARPRPVSPYELAPPTPNERLPPADDFEEF